MHILFRVLRLLLASCGSFLASCFGQLFHPEQFTRLASLSFDQHVTAEPGVFTDNRLACVLDVYAGPPSAPSIYFYLRDVATPHGPEQAVVITGFSFFHYLGEELLTEGYAAGQTLVTASPEGLVEAPLEATPGWTSQFNNEAGGSLLTGGPGFIGGASPLAGSAIRGGGVFEVPIGDWFSPNATQTPEALTAFARAVIEGVGIIAESTDGSMYGGAMTGQELYGVSPVPEPAAFAWAGVALLGLGMFRKRRFLT